MEWTPCATTSLAVTLVKLLRPSSQPSVKWEYLRFLAHELLGEANMMPPTHSPESPAAAHFPSVLPCC